MVNSCKIKVFFFNVLFLTGILLGGCEKSFPPIEEGNLTELQSKYVHPTAIESGKENIDVYIDYSSGMYEGIRANEKFMNELLRMVNSPTTKYYKVGAKDPIEVDIKQGSYIPWNLSNYTDQMSILDKPIEMITQNKSNISVFITDFELVKVPEKNLEISQNGQIFKSQIDISSWSINQFESWISEGNEIDIYAKKFTKDNFWVNPKTKQVQYIYTLLFTPKSLIASKNKNSLQARVYESNFKEIPDDFYHFSFSTKNYKVLQEKYTKESGGLTDALATTQFINGFKNRFEFYNFSNNDLVGFITNEDQKDKRLLKGLVFENNMTCYSELQVGLKVYDISAAWQNYYQYKTKPIPEVEKNVETGEAKSLADSVKFDYQKQEEVTEVFELVFNKENKQIGIKLNKDFIGVTSTTLYQIDIVFDKAGMTLSPDMDRVLQWRDSRGFNVTSLNASLKEAMQRVTKKMNGEIVYTYYILIAKG